jgi:hypothetical protein
MIVHIWVLLIFVQTVLAFVLIIMPAHIGKGNVGMMVVVEAVEHVQRFHIQL